jgi:transposase
VNDRTVLAVMHAEDSPAGRAVVLDRIDAEAALDGFYVLRTPVPADELDAPAVVTASKNLKYVERDFRHIKSDDLDLRPVFHRLEERVKAHVLICMLACYLTWHLRHAWAR